MSNGDIVVVGAVTGTHFIEDIKITVPHRVAVRIPGATALRSKDLWRAVQQQFIFLLEGFAGLHHTATPAPPPAPDERIAPLEEEVRTLRARVVELEAEVAAEKAKAEGLSAILAGLKGIQESLRSLENAPRMVLAAGTGAIVEGSSAVGGEAPTFIPDRIRPEEAHETQIRLATVTAEKTNVSSASTKLRELKRSGGG